MIEKKKKNVIIDTVYLDLFANEYVLETEVCAAPERYMIVRRGPDNKFIESWYLENGKSTKIHFDENTYTLRVHDLREQVECELGSKLSRMYEWEVPSNTFDQILKEMEIE